MKGAGACTVLVREGRGEWQKFEHRSKRSGLWVIKSFLWLPSGDSKVLGEDG